MAGEVTALRTRGRGGGAGGGGGGHGGVLRLGRMEWTMRDRIKIRWGMDVRKFLRSDTGRSEDLPRKMILCETRLLYHLYHRIDLQVLIHGSPE